jgi:hypothetical protein
VKLALLCISAAVAGCAAHTPVTVSMSGAPQTPASVVVPAAVVADPPSAPGASPLEGFLATGDARPATQTLRFDVDALPVATWGEGWHGAGFTLHKLKDGWSLWVRTTIFAEVIVTASGPSSENGTTPVGFTAFTGGPFGDGAVPACGPGSSGQRLAVWDGFAPAGWTNDGIDVEMEEGDYDLATCSGTPVRSLRGRAAAVVPGFVYALRAREEGDDGNGHESLVVFLPRGALVSTGADPRTPLEASNTGAFTRLTFPLARGTAGSASLRLSPVSLALWARLRQTRSSVAFSDPSPVAENLLLGFDVAWQGDARSGSLSLALPRAKDRKAYAGLLAAVKKRAM